MDKSWKELDAESAAIFERDMERGKKRSSADFDFFDAAHRARLQVTSDGLLPSRNADGEHRYAAQQGLRAACHTREDVIAISYIQRSLLIRLSGIRSLLWACLLVLVYIAYHATHW